MRAGEIVGNKHGYRLFCRISLLILSACLSIQNLWAQEPLAGVGVPAPVPLIDTHIPATVTDSLKAQMVAKKKTEAAKKAAAEALKRTQEALKAQKLALKNKKSVKKQEKKIARLHTSATEVELAKQTPLIAPQIQGEVKPDDSITLRPPALENPSSSVSQALKELAPTHILNTPSRIPLEGITPQNSFSTTNNAASLPNATQPSVATPLGISSEATPEPTSETEPSKFDRAWGQVKYQAGELFHTVAPEALLREKGMKPVSYSTLPGIAIFPVQRHGDDKAFGDLPVLFAQEYASKLALRIPDTHIYNPLYTVEALRLRGLGHVYDKIMAYYMKAGQPEPAATQYLLQQIAQEGKSISRLVFVEAELETGRPDRATGPLERLNALLTDGTLKSMKYIVHSRLQVFDVENPELPMIWAGSWARAVSFNRFQNVTRSVYDDSDSEQLFAGVSRDMSRELLYVMPKTAYMVPVYDTSVQGKLATPSNSAPLDSVPRTEPASGLDTAAPLSSTVNLNNENKQAIQRILKRQNVVSP